MICNVHTRVLPVPPDAFAHLIEGIAEAGNPIWPAPAWPPMVLDNGLEVGSAGGHGPIRYHVIDHQPGRRVEFRFEADTGIDGTHALEIVDGAEPGTTLVRHTLIGTPLSLSARLQWAFAIRWFHDAVLEEIMDRFATEVGHPPASPARWSWWVRFLRKVMRIDARVAAAPVRA